MSNSLPSEPAASSFVDHTLGSKVRCTQSSDEKCVISHGQLHVNGGDFCLQSSLNEVLMDITEEIQRREDHTISEEGPEGWLQCGHTIA